MYKCKNFKLYELLPKEIYKDEEYGWELLDEKLKITINIVRDILGVPLICNNWYWGGSRNWCGYRPIDCKIGAKMSAHKKGMAVGRISYCSDTELWYFYDNIDNAQFDTCKGTLLEVVNELIDTKHIADNFRLLEFYTNDDD